MKQVKNIIVFLSILTTLLIGTCANAESEIENVINNPEQIKEENNMPLFVTVTAGWCTGCQKLKPIVEELKYEYQGKLKFITFDSSTKQLIDESWQLAEENGVKWFYDKYKATLPAVGIFCGSSTKADKEFLGEVNKESYQQFLDNLLLNGTKICSLK